MESSNKPPDISRFRLAWRKADMILDVEGHGRAVSLVVIAAILLIAYSWFT